AEPLPAAQPGEHGWLQDGDLCLLVAPAGGPGRGPRPPGRRPKGDFSPGPRRDLGPPPRRPRPRGDELRSPDRRPPNRRPPDRDPPDRDPEDRRGPRREGPGNWLAVEFEASTARNLLQRTTGTLATGTAGALLLMVAVLLFWRQAKARESAQRRLEQREKLSALGEMSAVLAHEIRNPLASLKGHAQLLAERLPEDHPEGRKVKRIVREAARLEGLTSDLLDFVRTGELHTRPVDPVAFAEEVRREIDAERIHLHAEDAPPLWSFDPDRLRQVLTNLLRNALQASPPEAPVHLEVGVAQAQGERFLRMAVGDHGPGLPAGLEGSIFDPFVTTRTQGTGLGLAVSKRIVELHGGTLSGRNHPAGGAELEVRLPEL
ncbi:MAG: ATP-binding protein, partial [Acidobacteriota bacterium]